MLLKKIVLTLMLTIFVLCLSVFSTAFTEYLLQYLTLKQIIITTFIITFALLLLGIIKIKDVKMI
jgi:hypothetical protein